MPKNVNGNTKLNGQFHLNSLKCSKGSGEVVSTFITNYDEMVNASTDLVEFCE